MHDFIPPDRFVFAEGPPMRDDTNALIARAPVGRGFVGPNSAAPSDSSFHHENAVKIGADLYAAGGIDDPLTANEFTRDALEIRLALMTSRQPTRADIRRTVYVDEVEVFDR